MSNTIRCDGIDCESAFKDHYPPECPYGWVRFHTFAPSGSATGGLCPSCWLKANVVDMVKNRPWLLKGRQTAPAKADLENETVKSANQSLIDACHAIINGAGFPRA